MDQNITYQYLSIERLKSIVSESNRYDNNVCDNRSQALKKSKRIVSKFRNFVSCYDEKLKKIVPSIRNQANNIYCDSNLTQLRDLQRHTWNIAGRNIHFSPQLFTVGVVVSERGSTVRDGVNIDDSNIIMTLSKGTKIYIAESRLLVPSKEEEDEDIISVPRHRIVEYQNEKGRFPIQGWVSEHGRLKTDKSAIISLENDLATMESHNTETTKGKDDIISMCPLCFLEFTTDMTVQDQNSHIDSCAKLYLDIS